VSAELDAFKRLELLSVAYPGEPWNLGRDEPYSPSASKQGAYVARLKQALAAHPPDTSDAAAGPAGGQPRQLTFNERWAALEARADAVSRESWPLMKATASLANSANELELHRLSARNFEQLLDAAQRRQRPSAAPLEPGATFTVQRTPWAVDGVFRHGLNLLVGQPGAGKSRLAAAAIAAWLRGDQTWLAREMPCDLPVEDRHALIIGTDQGLEDWALTLEPVGLVIRESGTQVRCHPRLTLHTLEVGTALDADGLALIRRWCDAHPHGAVLVDSLAACLPPGIDEDKSAVARPVHALAEALGNCWAVLTHHMRKGAGKDQNLGVGAGRGSSAIDGAVSRVIGLGLIHKMENGVMTPQEADPRRELLSTKRGGATLHLVIRSDATGFWTNEGSAEDLKRQERKERTIANLTDAQSAAISALEDADGWLTGRQVAEALLEPGESYDARGSHAAATRKTLKRLEVLGLIETMRVGLDRLYRVPDPRGQQGGVSQESHPHGDEFDLTGSNGSKTAAQGISVAHPEDLTGSDWLSPVVASGEPCEPVVSQGVLTPVRANCEPVRAIGEPVGEPAKTVAAQCVSHSSHPPAHTAALTGSPGLAVTVEGEGGWWLPSGRIPKSGNTVAIDPEGRSHHIAAIGIQLDLSSRAA
jgi:hypothetical protein